MPLYNEVREFTPTHYPPANTLDLDECLRSCRDDYSAVSFSILTNLPFVCGEYMFAHEAVNPAIWNADDPPADHTAPIRSFLEEILDSTLSGTPDIAQCRHAESQRCSRMRVIGTVAVDMMRSLQVNLRLVPLNRRPPCLRSSMS